MKRVLLYLLMSVSMAVLAQQQQDQEASVENENIPPASAEQPVENTPPEESGDTDSSDKDFKPSEEIPEDYPVPLPSDI